MIDRDNIMLSCLVDPSQRLPLSCSSIFVANCGLPTNYPICTYRYCMCISDSQAFHFDAPLLIFNYNLVSHTSTIFAIVYIFFSSLRSSRLIFTKRNNSNLHLLQYHKTSDQIINVGIPITEMNLSIATLVRS